MDRLRATDVSRETRATAATGIAERAFSLARIRRALREHFPKVQAYGEGWRRASELADRVYFVCQ